jgi:hypothetical protein
MTNSNPGVRTPQHETLEQKTRVQLQQNARNGSSYFFWIAFFSIFNKVMDMLSTKRRFVFGLGAPQYIERSLAVANPALIWGITIALAIVFVFFGVFARRRNIPIYTIGIFVYLVDMALSILSGDIVGALVHVVFTVLLVLGLIATRKLKDLPSA